MAEQRIRGLWKRVVVPFAAYLFLFVGMGLVAGSVVHFGETDQIPRFLSIGLVGMGLFIVGSYIQETRLNTNHLKQEGVIKYVLYSLLLAIGIGMLSGGTQHFLDFPIYASYLLPVGFLLALIAYVLRNNLTLGRKGWAALLTGAFMLSIPAFLGLNLYAKALPVNAGHHGSGHHGSGHHGSGNSGSGHHGAEHSDLDHQTMPAQHPAPSHTEAATGGANHSSSNYSIAAEKTPLQRADSHNDDGHSHRHEPVSRHPVAGDTAVKLTGLGNLGVNRSVPIQFTVLDETGKPVEALDRLQEKLMHLIVVSDDLTSFEHLHPDYEGEGQFQVTATFPQPGAYTLFSDYQPANQPEKVGVLQMTVPGIVPASPTPDFTTQRSIDGIQANLQVSPAQPRSGEEVTLTLTLKDALSDRTLQGLQPYLGEKGHLVIIQQAPMLTQADYIHAHAIKAGPAEQISFTTTFPQAGQYKLWGQFQQDNKIIVADFWVKVS